MEVVILEQLKITKKKMQDLIKNGSNEKILSKREFYNIILSDSILNIPIEKAYKTLDKTKVYDVYWKSALHKRVKEKLNFIYKVKNIENTTLFRKMIMSCTNLDDTFNYEACADSIIYNLRQHKGIDFYYEFETDAKPKDRCGLGYSWVDYNGNNTHSLLVNRYGDDYDYVFENNTFEEQFRIKENSVLNDLKEELIYFLKEINFEKYCNDCKEYQLTKILERNNRMYEKEENLLRGGFDYLLVKALENGDFNLLFDLVKYQTNIVYRKSKCNVIEEHIKRRNAKYNDDGERNLKLHNEFKKQLKEMMNHCVLTGTMLETYSGVECCHIKPYKFALPDECKDGNNGILLIHDFHVLFDNGMITFDDEGILIISPYINILDKRKIEPYENVIVNEIKTNEQRQKYLKWHRENVFLNGKENDINFNFDESVEDWNVRKDMVDFYMDQMDVHNRLNADSSNKQLNTLVYKMYNYVLFAMDKKILKPNEPTLDKIHFDVLCNLILGINGYVDKRKRNKKINKEPKYCLIDINKINENHWKRKQFNDEFGGLIEEQKKEYKQLLNNLSCKSRQWFEEKTIEIVDKEYKLNKRSIKTNLYNDINECNKALEKINNVEIKKSLINHHSRFDDFDFEYDKTIIKKSLKHFHLLKSTVKENPFSCIHVIYLDLIEMLKQVKLTKKQKRVLNKVISGGSLDKKEENSFELIIIKLYNVSKK